jgi:hypothetical protein
LADPEYLPELVFSKSPGWRLGFLYLRRVMEEAGHFAVVANAMTVQVSRSAADVNESELDRRLLRSHARAGVAV